MLRVAPFIAAILLTTSSLFAAPPFTLSKETTALTTPLNDDGTPDYVAALNAIYGKDVTPTNNAFTGWIETIGNTASQLSPKTAPQILKLCGARDIPPTPFVTLNAIFQNHNLTGKALEDAQNEDFSLHRRMWTAAEFPLMAEALDTDKAFLDKMHNVWSRPKYWCPSVPADGRSFFSVLLPSLGQMREAANLLASRATLRAASNDFDGFLSDALTLKHLAHHLANQPTIIEHLVGYVINTNANRAISAAASSGHLSAAQCDKLSQALADLPPFSPLADSIDTCERWCQLDNFIIVATGKAALLSTPDNATFDIFINIDVGDVDWNTVLTRVNDHMDKIVDAAKRPTLDEQQIAMRDIDAHMPKGVTRSTALFKLPDETPDAYTDRVAQKMMGTLLPSLGRADELYRTTLMYDQMTIALIAAAKYHADKNSWPDSLDSLMPAYLPQLPADIYSTAQSDPVRFTLYHGIPTLYSIGRNRFDDGGINDSQTHRDDLSLGCEPKAVSGP